MKRRLDLGLALVHGPELLFLDEPTTGLDPQSRAALWDEVRRLANDGVTVFLTTQYLEEADVLADRVGIIDRGKIVAEGTPAELKAAIGRSSVEAIPADPGDKERAGCGPARFGEAGGLPERRGGAASGGRGGPSRDRRGRSMPRACRSPICACTPPRWTTSSWPRPGARSRAPPIARTGARTGRPQAAAEPTSA